MVVYLEDRIVLRLYNEGKEKILTFLQQITSNDLLKKENNLIYTLFLSANGKFLFDGFIFCDDHNVYLDCYIEKKDEIINHIKKYKARLDIKFEETSYYVYADFDGGHTNEHLYFSDPRGLGSRFYLKEKINGDDLIWYHKKRVKENIPEGIYDIVHDKYFPIYFHMHEINAISLTKGCYIGQEPTNRLYRTGVIRKKVEPFVLKEKNINLKIGDNLNNGIICSIFDGECGFLILDL